MSYVYASTNTTSKEFRASLILLAFSAFLAVSNANVIGVDLSGNAKKKGSPKGGDSVALFDPVIRLNRFSFQQTIVDEHDSTGAFYSDAVPHWIVLFCPTWYEPCQALEPLFQSLTTKWEDQLNGALLSAQVRFAAVDCATEKALCNTQNVNTYPFVAHYRKHQQVSRWRGQSYATAEKSLRAFLQNELGATEQMQDVSAQGGMKMPWDGLVDWFSDSFRAPARYQGLVNSTFWRISKMIIAILVFAVIAFNALYIGGSSIWLLRNETSSSAAPSTVPRTPKEDEPCSSFVKQAAYASCTMRSLPKEWGNDRPSLVL